MMISRAALQSMNTSERCRQLAWPVIVLSTLSSTKLARRNQEVLGEVQALHYV